MPKNVKPAVIFLEQGGKITFLPSSFLDIAYELVKYRKHLKVFVRELTSYNEFIDAGFAKDEICLLHDMAFAINPEYFSQFSDKNKGSGEIDAFRNDEESQFFSKSNEFTYLDISSLVNGSLWHDKDLTISSVLRAIEHISFYQAINTDRLHITILSALLWRNVKVYDNTYHKIRSVYEHSLKNFSNVIYIGASKALSEKNAIQEIRTLPLNDESELKWESLRNKLKYYEKTRREWWEPELARLNQDIENREKVKNTWFDPELIRLNSLVKDFEDKNQNLILRLNELEEVKKSWFEPEIEKLNALNKQLVEENAGLTNKEQSLIAHIQELEEVKKSWFEPARLRERRWG